ncbi:MAG TPA: MaoC/PaaZ C-terminal domain-containing protein [Acidimicrobiales bacterium]|nr:MaoC/PaaZ C-terminal domain-containing protein [Acidimicrobiales bacterium]
MTLKLADLSVGQAFTATVVENLTRTQIVQYAGASGDYNPLHTDEVFATQVAGYPSVFAHGMLTMGLTGRMLTDLVGDGRLLSFGGRFTSQVWPGDDLATTATVEAVHEAGDGDGPSVDLVLSTVNQDGAEVFSGHASARVDG